MWPSALGKTIIRTVCADIATSPRPGRTRDAAYRRWNAAIRTTRPETTRITNHLLRLPQSGTNAAGDVCGPFAAHMRTGAAGSPRLDRAAVVTRWPRLTPDSPRI